MRCLHGRLSVAVSQARRPWKQICGCNTCTEQHMAPWCSSALPCSSAPDQHREHKAPSLSSRSASQQLSHVSLTATCMMKLCMTWLYCAAFLLNCTCISLHVYCSVHACLGPMCAEAIAAASVTMCLGSQTALSACSKRFEVMPSLYCSQATTQGVSPAEPKASLVFNVLGTARTLT